MRIQLNCIGWILNSCFTDTVNSICQPVHRRKFYCMWLEPWLSSFDYFCDVYRSPSSDSSIIFKHCIVVFIQPNPNMNHHKWLTTLLRNIGYRACSRTILSSFSPFVSIQIFRSFRLLAHRITASANAPLTLPTTKLYVPQDTRYRHSTTD